MAYKNTHLASTKLDWPDLSVVLIVKNELANLSELLPVLLSLEYKGKFDIHILDDASSDGSVEFIEQNFTGHNQIKIHYSTSWFSIGKKKRLLELSDIETHPITIFTDADCRPGPKWLESMAIQAEKKNIVLGFSPYYDNTTAINKVIQFETRLTALMYMGLANLGCAYMGIGRNILYNKKTLFSGMNLTKYNTILSGDDDLTVNELRKLNKPGINLSPESFVYSIPKTAMADWLRQKQRHVTTAKYYNRVDQLILFSFYSTYVAWWLGIWTLIIMDFRFALIGVIMKLVWYISFRYLNSKIFKYVFSWFKMISADIFYTFSLIYLLPAATIRKMLKW